MRPEEDIGKPSCFESLEVSCACLFQTAARGVCVDKALQGSGGTPTQNLHKDPPDEQSQKEVACYVETPAYLLQTLLTECLPPSATQHQQIQTTNTERTTALRSMSAARLQLRNTSRTSGSSA